MNRDRKGFDDKYFALAKKVELVIIRCDHFKNVFNLRQNVRENN